MTRDTHGQPSPERFREIEGYLNGWCDGVRLLVPPGCFHPRVTCCHAPHQPSVVILAARARKIGAPLEEIEVTRFIDTFLPQFHDRSYAELRAEVEKLRSDWDERLEILALGAGE